MPLNILQSAVQLFTTNNFLVQNTNSTELENPYYMVGLTWWLSGKEPACWCRRWQSGRHGFDPWHGLDPWKAWVEELRSLLCHMAKRKKKCKKNFRNSLVGSVGREDPLEKKMATHSSILAWEIPWTEKPGRLQSMGLQKSWTQFRD